MAPKKQKDGRKIGPKGSDHPEKLEVVAKTLEPPESRTPREAVEVKAAEPNISKSDATTTQSTQSAKKKTGGPRSVCAMYKVVKKKALGKKLKVTYDEFGVPNGKTRHTLQSYVGMTARSMVPIDIPSWREVSHELKQKLWQEIQSTFKVAPESERMVLTSASLKWRQFKTKLTTSYVLPLLGDKKKLAKPPKQYAFVGRDHWKKFVAMRKSEEWKKLHKVQSGRVKKRKHPHRTSRKGYIGLKEEEIKAGRLKVGETLDRAIFWKKARMRKDMKVDDEQAEINERIDDLLEKKEKGEFTPSGSEDVLTTALRTPEHSGRVRGVGGFVSPTVYFNLPKQRRVRVTKSELMARDREREEEFEKMRSELEQLKALITATPTINFSPNFSDKASFQVQREELDEGTKLKKSKAAKGLKLDEDEECVAIPPPPPPSDNYKGPMSCELAVDNTDNKVAFGMAFVDEGDMNKTIHGKPMPAGSLRVSVDGWIKREALVPFPVHGEIETVEHAVGSHVAWPKEWIIFPQLKKDEVSHKKKELKRLKALLSAVEPDENVPQGFALLYKHATGHMKVTGEAIQLPCDVEMFGVDKTIFVLQENLLELLKYKMIGQAVISAYMWHLFNVIRDRDELETFTFIDPSSTYTTNADFESYIVRRLKEGNVDRLFFMPHNHNAHWILVIIWEGEIYILNPLSLPKQFVELEKALVSAVKTFNAETGRGNKVPKVKNLTGSPKQPGGHECGYVVMRYMKEIIDDKELKFVTRWMTKTRRIYTREELDEVREEALRCIQFHIK